MPRVLKVAPDVFASKAIFSADRLHRFQLYRLWDASLPRCIFIMLNPSIADENTNDPTVAKCERFARKWGYGSLEVLNLFSRCCTDPDGLHRVMDHKFGENTQVIMERTRSESAQRGIVVCAWGCKHSRLFNRGESIRSKLERAGVPIHSLRLSSSNEPHHPLYLPESLVPKIWATPGIRLYKESLNGA